MTRLTVEELQKMSWFSSLLKQIENELAALCAVQHDLRPSLQKELEEIRQQLQGWSQSLAKPELSSSVREMLEGNLEASLQRTSEIERQLADADVQRRRASTIVEPEQVVDRLNRLADVLAAQNPTQTNLELSLHIDTIRCYGDGRVVVRTCKLGAITGNRELIAESAAVTSEAAKVDPRAISVKPRRLSVRRVTADDQNLTELQAAALHAADANRFAGLGDEWFWEDEFKIPRSISCAERQALEVAQKRLIEGMSEAALAKHFRRSIPWIRKAIAIAKVKDPSFASLPKKMPRRRWAEDHAAEVAQQYAIQQCIAAVARYFGKSDPTIRAALRYAAEKNALQNDTASAMDPSQ